MVLEALERKKERQLIAVTDVTAVKIGELWHGHHNGRREEQGELRNGDPAATPGEFAGERKAQEAIASGAGLERFRRIIEQQGGDPRVVDDYDRLPKASARQIVTAPRSGYVSRLDAELIGRASVSLGAGRDRVEDMIDPAVGITVVA